MKIREIRQLRERMKAAAETTRAKEELYKQLVSLHLFFTYSSSQFIQIHSFYSSIHVLSIVRIAGLETKI